MQLNLDSTEANVLLDVLSSHLAGLRVEIGRTDHRQFREMLLRRDEVVERIMTQLNHSADT